MRAFMAAGKKLATFALAITAALAVLLGLTAPAYAADVTVWGAQTLLPNDNEINLVNMTGAEGDAVYFTVKKNSNNLCRNLVHTLGENGQTGDSVADTFSLVLPDGVSESDLKEGSYTVEAYDRRGSGGSQLYSGTVYGVWARVSAGDGESPEFLIGTRTAGSGESFTFVPPSMTFHDGTAYRLVSNSPEMDGELAYFTYEPYDETNSVDGTISYVDKEGTLLRTDTIPGIPENGSVTKEIPATITANGKLYRTMGYQNSVTATNPGQVAFTIPCVDAGAVPYVANIHMVDEEGNVIASDSLNVDKTYTYTVPTNIYKNVDVDGETRVVTYTLQDDQVYYFDPREDADQVVNGERTITVHYNAQELDEGSVEVTYYQIDGQNEQQGTGRMLGTVKRTVDESNPTATPPASVTVDGITYKLASSASDYTYTYGSGATPVINAYYVAEGYEGGDPYDVTVNYVNMLTGEVIKSEVYTSSPDPAVIQITSPADFSESGIDYVRLQGQSEPIAHNHFSLMRTYNIYYRDANDTLTAGTVIERTRVVFDGVTNLGTTVVGTTGAAGATGATGAAGGATGGVNANLNPTTSYSTIGGTGNQTIVNEQGQDSNTERIEETQNPLASGTEDEEGAEGTDETGSGVFGDLGIAVSTLFGVIVAALLIWLLLVKRRRDDDEQEA